MFGSTKWGVIFEMEPPYNKVQLLLLTSTLLLFGLLHLQHLLFCCNASLFLVYNTVLSQLSHYHKSLWKAESHFSIGHVGSNSHVINVCKNFILFFNPKVLQHSSLLGCGRNACGISFVEAHCAVVLYAFF